MHDLIALMKTALMIIVCTTALYTLKAALDKHALLMTRTIVQRPCVCTMVQSGDQGDEISVNKGRLKRGGENLNWTLILLFLEQN